MIPLQPNELSGGSDGGLERRLMFFVEGFGLT
jgi:hypothetical protein